MNQWSRRRVDGVCGLLVFPTGAPADIGGLGLSTTAVGLLQAGAGLATLSGVVVAFPFMVSRFGVPGAYGRCLVASALCYLVPPVLAAHAGRETPWVGLLLANACVSLATQVTFASFNVMLKNCVAPQHVGAAIGYGSAAGTCGRGPASGLGVASTPSTRTARDFRLHRFRARPALGREPLRRVVGTQRVGRPRQRAPLLSRPRDARGGEFAIGAPPRSSSAPRRRRE